MNRSPSTVGPADAIPAQRFRAQATGCAPTLEASAAQGLARAHQVVECMPAAQKKAVAPAQGYPR